MVSAPSPKKSSTTLRLPGAVYRSDLLGAEIGLKEALTRSRLAGDLGDVDPTDLSNLNAIAEVATLTFECLERARMPPYLLDIIRKLIWASDDKSDDSSTNVGEETRSFTYVELCKQFKYERHELFSNASHSKEEAQGSQQEFEAAKLEAVVQYGRVEELEARLVILEQENTRLQLSESGLERQLRVAEEANSVAQERAGMLEEGMMSREMQRIDAALQNTNLERQLNGLNTDPVHLKTISEQKAVIDRLGENMARLSTILAKQEAKHEEITDLLKTERVRARTSERGFKRAEADIERLKEERKTMLRPYTPRPNFEAMYDHDGASTFL
jgi:hypothetical protein